MVFTVCSNEHTVKVILNSKLATDASVKSNLKFNLRTPIISPMNMVSMVCLESATIKAPSMFSEALLNDPSNKFERRILTDGDLVPYDVGGTDYSVQDYWNTADVNTAVCQGNGDGNTGGATEESWLLPTNITPIKTIFSRTGNQTLSSPDTIGAFLYEFLMRTRCFKIIIKAVNSLFVPIKDVEIYWTDKIDSYTSGNPATTHYTNYGCLLGSSSLRYAYNGQPDVFTVDSPVQYFHIGALLKLYTEYTFTLQLRQDANILDQNSLAANYTTEFRMAGKWLKIFGLNPGLNDVNDGTKCLVLTTGTPTAQLPTFTFQTGGYDLINIHTSFAKSVYSASNSLNNSYIVPTNILWSIQLVSEPASRTYFTNMNTAGKVSYFMPIMEDIEVYFSDDWGDLITDPIEFQLVLTFDFSLPDPFPEPDTIKRARTRLEL